MKTAIQNKINNLKAISKGGAVTKKVSIGSLRTVNDSLSRAIRTKRDADIFRKELKVAFKLAKK